MTAMLAIAAVAGPKRTLVNAIAQAATIHSTSMRSNPVRVPSTLTRLPTSAGHQHIIAHQVKLLSSVDGMAERIERCADIVADHVGQRHDIECRDAQIFGKHQRRVRIGVTVPSPKICLPASKAYTFSQLSLRSRRRALRLANQMGRS